jgi:hypothetical protein
MPGSACILWASLTPCSPQTVLLKARLVEVTAGLRQVRQRKLHRVGPNFGPTLGLE